MSIPVGGEIGVEMHDDVEQFIRIESGEALVLMRECKEALNCRQTGELQLCCYCAMRHVA